MGFCIGFETIWLVGLSSYEHNFLFTTIISLMFLSPAARNTSPHLRNPVPWLPLSKQQSEPPPARRGTEDRCGLHNDRLSHGPNPASIPPSPLARPDSPCQASLRRAKPQSHGRAAPAQRRLNGATQQAQRGAAFTAPLGGN